MLKNSVQNSGAWEMKDYELSSSALQVRLYGSDILSLNPAFLFTLCQSFSVRWIGDECLPHPLPCSAASPGQRQGHRSFKEKARMTSPSVSAPPFLPLVLMGFLWDTPNPPRAGQHLDILSLSSKVHWSFSGA